jgi:hypothetical protein
VTIVGLVGILLGLLAWPFAFVERTRLRVSVFALAFLVHVASAIVYYLYVQTASADTAMYFYDPYGLYGEGFGLNTLFIVYVVQAMKVVFGGTYLDYFFVFQSVGFIGIALLMELSTCLPPRSALLDQRYRQRRSPVHCLLPNRLGCDAGASTLPSPRPGNIPDAPDPAPYRPCRGRCSRMGGLFGPHYAPLAPWRARNRIVLRSHCSSRYDAKHVPTRRDERRIRQ